MDDVETEEFDELRDSIIRMDAHVRRLEEAIRKHRDQRGDNRCWLDDVELYRSLRDELSEYAVDTELPPKCDFLMSCSRYWDQRQRPSDKNLTPSCMTLAQLQAEVERLRDLTPPPSSPSSGPSSEPQAPR